MNSLMVAYKSLAKTSNKNNLSKIIKRILDVDQLSLD